jgi:hypothetical protein
MQNSYYKIQSSISGSSVIHQEPRFPRRSRKERTVNFHGGEFIASDRLVIPPPYIHETNHDKGMTPEPFLTGTYPVVNDLFVKTMINAGADNFQLFPATLRSTVTDYEWTGYHIFNVVGLIDAALMEECNYDIIMEGNGAIPPVIGFHKYVFSAEKLKNEPRMFRLWQSRDLFISDHVMKVLEDIMPLDKWNISATEIPVK